MIYLLKKYKLIFIFNAKCACTTIKNIIGQMENIKIKKYFDVHNMNFNNVSIDDVINNYYDYQIIFFKRNPYERFVSGYSKVTNGLILKLRFLLNKTQKQCNKLVNNGNISLSNFVDLITSQQPKNLDNHFVPQTFRTTMLFNSRPNFYIYEIDDLYKFDKFLDDTFNIKINLNIHKKYNQKKKHLLSDEDKQKIHDYYIDDFELLGYEKEKTLFYKIMLILAVIAMAIVFYVYSVKN